MVLQDDMWSDKEYVEVFYKIQRSDQNSSVLEWNGEKGNSLRSPKDKSSELSKLLNCFGVEGIPYNNGDVDFSQVSKYEIEFVDVKQLYLYLGTTIKFGDLTSKCSVKSRDHFRGIIRQKWQLVAMQWLLDRIKIDNQFAKDFSEKTGVDTSSINTVSGLKCELKRKGLTLHETTDCKKIQFVSTRIHKAFRHTGGIVEMLEKLINGDIHNRVNT